MRKTFIFLLGLFFAGQVFTSQTLAIDWASPKENLKKAYGDSKSTIKKEYKSIKKQADDEKTDGATTGKIKDSSKEVYDGTKEGIKSIKEEVAE